MMAIHNFCRSSLCGLGLAFLGTAALLSLLTSGRTVWAADDKTVEQIKGDERIAVLRFLAARNEANYRKIETWRGKYHFVDRYPQKIQLATKTTSPPDKTKPSPEQFEMRDVIAIHEGTMEFALDVTADKLWSEYQEDGSKVRFLSLDGKEEITPLSYNAAEEKQILTADRLTKLSNLNYGPLPQYPDDPNRVRNTSSKLAQRSAYREIERTKDSAKRLDPRRFYATGTVSVWEELNLGIKALTGEDGADAERRAQASRALEVTKSGAPGACEYKVSIRFFSGPPNIDALPLKVIRYTEQEQYLPIEQILYKKEGGTIHQHRSCIYQRMNGILFPKEFHFTINNLRDGKLILSRHLQFVEGIFNEPLPEDTFSIDHLRLTKGDRLEDMVESSLFVSDGSKLLTADQYTAGVKDSRSAASRHRVWWLVFNLSLLAVALAVLLIRWRLRSQKLKG